MITIILNQSVNHHHIDTDGVDEANTNLSIDQSVFKGNINYLPVRGLHILNDAIAKTGYYRVPIPIQGAGSIAIYYLQNLYDVNTEISNTKFLNNHGSISGSAIIMSISSIRSITKFKDCSLSNEDTEPNVNDLHARGGISYIYLLLRNAPGIYYSPNTTIASFNPLYVFHCNFSMLRGTLGAALHIEKVASTQASLVVRIEECNFTDNAANAGSAVYAVDRRFGASASCDSLTVHFVNVNAEKNTISSSSTIDYDTSDFITGVFHTKNSHFIVNCFKHCKFTCNQPSVFYGHDGYITVSGKAAFTHNKAYSGGVFHLRDTLLYVYNGSELLFAHNHATFRGGAIIVRFSATNVQSEDICPIQFIGPSDTDPIFSLDDLDRLNVNITFEKNTVGNSSSLQSIYANVFYVCSWHPDTLTQYDFDLNVPPINGTRDTVYRRVFNFTGSIDNHLNIVASLPCPCNSSGYDAVYCMTAGYNKTLKLPTPIIIGRPFQLSLVGLDEVGSVGATTTLYSDVYTTNATDGTLTLANGQNRRTFLTTNKTCSTIDFTVYGIQSTQPTKGILSLSFSRGMRYEFHVNFSNCPVGFSYKKDNFKNNSLYSCVCSKFLKFNVHDDFHCDSSTGIITRNNLRSWLSVNGDKIEYTELCLPTYCNRNGSSSFMLSDTDHHCKNNHTGRACGACIEGYGRVFGSTSCKHCSNAWLATIILYGLLGVILVFILFVLRLTITVGAINGVIFFCNVMSINENLFFNENQFSFLRVFISLINLDLGFDMCFYNEMTQIAKTGLQFVFPIYLWLLIMIIIFTEKFHFRRKISSYSAVPVLATLIILSYSKLLRTTISVFSFVTIHYTSNESNYSVSQSVVTWLPDSSVKYLQGWHCVLFVFSLAVLLLFVLPFTFSSTFPKIILRSKRLSYFFPLFDCYYAPYKDKYRFWLGTRLIVLVYLSAIDSVLFSYQEASLLSGVVVVLAFAIVQAYIHPFKNTLINVLDLMFTGIFTLLSVITLYLYPTTSGYDEVNIGVNILGFVAFFLFCLVIVFHIHNVVKHTKWYNRVVSALEMKFNVKEKWNHFSQGTAYQKFNSPPLKDKGTPYFIQYQESFFAHL